MRNILAIALCFMLLAGCAQRSPAPADLAALAAQLGSSHVTVDADCIFSAPVKNRYIAYRNFGLCLFDATHLHLYHAGAKPVLAFAWRMTAIKAYALHADTFTLVTDAGNFGLVVRDSAALVAALRAQGVPEDAALPLFRAMNERPFDW